MPTQSERQWRVLLQVVGDLNSAEIPYNIDASTALFVHGIAIEMDDIAYFDRVGFIHADARVAGPACP